MDRYLESLLSLIIISNPLPNFSKDYDFKVVYTPPVDDKPVEIKVYVDGELLTTTNKFYYESANTPGNAKSYINFLRIVSQAGTEGTVYIDDMTVTQ